MGAIAPTDDVEDVLASDATMDDRCKVAEPASPEPAVQAAIPSVTAQLAIHNVDYEMLSAGAKAELTAGVREVMAEKLGMPVSDVAVTLTKGIAKQVAIAVSSMWPLTSAIQDALAEGNLASKVLEKVETLEGVKEASTWPIDVFYGNSVSVEGSLSLREHHSPDA